MTPAAVELRAPLKALLLGGPSVLTGESLQIAASYLNRKKQTAAPPCPTRLFCPEATDKRVNGLWCMHDKFVIESDLMLLEHQEIQEKTVKV